MNMTQPSALWDFAVALYGRPGISEACLALQDEYGVDVPLLLYATWLGEEGRKLSALDVADILKSIRPWQNEVVMPLRVLRRRLKEGPPPAPSERTETLRNAIKGAELLAERIELELLEGSGRHLALPEGGTTVANMLAVMAHYHQDLPNDRLTALVEKIALAAS